MTWFRSFLTVCALLLSSSTQRVYNYYLKHCFLRRECLELIEEKTDVEDFLPVKKRRKVSCKVGGQLSELTDNDNDDDNDHSKYPKRVGLCCTFCKQTNGTAALWPNSFRESHFYCKIINWKRTHFDSCPLVPDAIRQSCERASEDKSRGRKAYCKKEMHLTYHECLHIYYKHILSADCPLCFLYLSPLIHRGPVRQKDRSRRDQR